MTLAVGVLIAIVVGLVVGIHPAVGLLWRFLESAPPPEDAEPWV